MPHILKKTIRFFSPLIFLLLMFVNHEAVSWAQEITWEYGVPASGKQQTEAMTVDSQGNTILTGFGESTSTDFFTAKVKADGSGLAWPAVSFDLAGGNDVATAVAVDANDDIIVTGYAHNGSHYDIQTIKYSGVDGSVIWQHTFDSEAHGDDRATAIAVDSLDNVYVGGYGQGSSGKNDFIILKYAPSGPNPDDTPTWDFTYNGPADGNDLITAIAAGIDGLAVTGKSQNATPDYDCLTFKLGFDKVLAWPQPQRYADTGDGEGRAVAMDGEGNVVMTGFVFDHVAAGSKMDLFTIKYGAADGTPVWVQPLDRGYDDEGRAIYIDESGAVYVVGTTFSLSSATDVLTIKYNADGVEQWSEGKLYNSANGNNDVGVAIVAVEGGDLFVAGYSNDAVSGHDRILLLKYRKDNGSFLWDRLFVGNNEDNRAKGLGVSPNGDVLVGGWSDRGSAGASDYDYYVIHYASGELNPPTDLSAETITNTEIALSWTDNSLNEENFVLERKICTESTYNSITILPPGTGTGTMSYNSIGLTPDTRYCYRVKATNTTDGSSPYSNEADARTTVVSYEPPTWLYRFNGPDDGDDYPGDIATGPDSNPVLTGHSFSLTGAFDYLTVKLDRSNAAELWQARYDDPDFESDFATSVAVDSHGRVIVTGFASLYGGGAGNTNDVFTLGYQGDGLPLDAGGNPVALWSDQYNGPEGGDDRSSAVAAATDGSDNSVVIGYGRNLSWNDDIYVIRYLPDGTRAWAATPYDGGGNDYPAAVGFDSSGDVFVGGSTDSGADRDFFVAKYRGSDGAMIWKDTFSGSGNGDDYVEDLAVDAAGNLYVCGYSFNAAGNGDFYTIKYDGAGDGVPDANGVFGGRILWQQAYDGGGYDRAVGVRIDPVNGDVVVAGTTYVGPGNHDFHVIRYSAAGEAGAGKLVWAKTLDQPTDDAVVAMDVDWAGTACVAGTAFAGNSDMLAVKFDAGGTVVGANRFAGSAGKEDAAVAVVVNTYGEAFVAGSSLNADNNADFVVFKAGGEVMQAPVPLAATQSYTRVDLAWTDHSLNEAGFRIERKTGACSAVSSWAWVVDADPDATTYADDTLNVDSTYCYRVASFNAGGERSPWVQVEAATSAPPAPGDLSGAVRSTTEIELSWTDTTAGEDGFLVERCSGEGCSFTLGQTVSFPVGAGQENFTDTSACPENAYSYRVHAFRTNAWVSEWSNTAADLNTPATAAPSNLIAPEVHEDRVELGWRDNTADETSFVIERCSGQGAGCDEDSEFAPIGTAPAGVDGLRLHYRMEEAAWSGAVGEVADHSGEGKNGTAYGGAATVSGGEYGRAGSFDGSNDYLATPLTIDQSATSVGTTFQAWVYPTDSTSSYRFVFGTENGGYDWGLIQYGSTWYVSSGNSYQSTGLSVDINAWQHIVAVFIPGTGIRFYKNGGSPAAISDIGYDTSTATLKIGSRDGSSNFFMGRIDEVAVYDRPLSSAEIQTLYQQGITRFADFPPAHSSWYTYRVRAAKEGGCGWPSAPSNTVSVQTIPPPPDNLSAAALDTTRVRLQWRDNTHTETGFRIYRDGQETGTSDPDIVEFTDTEVCPNTPHVYQVTAFRTGEWETGPSNTANATTLGSSVPTPGTVGVSEEQVNLEWTYPNKDFTGFHLSRCQVTAEVTCTQDADFQPLPDMADAPAGALLHYRMDETAWSGTGAVRDNSANGGHGTAYNGLGTVSQGKYGWAGSFDGSNDYIASPVNLDQSATSAGVTFEAWVYPTDSSSTYRYVFGTDNGGYDWGLLQYGTTWYVSSGNAYQSTGLPVTINTWQHIVAVFIPGTGIRVYKNGAAPAAVSDIGYDTSDYNVTIGQKGNSTYYFAGRIDEAAVYGRALTQQEITDRYNARMRLVQSGLPSGTTFNYRLWAFKSAGCPWQGPYASVAATTVSPPAPEPFTGSAIDTTRIDLGWSDNTTSETGYRLDHCPGALLECLGDPGAIPPVPPSKAFDDPPLTFGSTTLGYSDTRAQVCAGTIHTYRVRAEPWPSAWAGPLQITTPAAAAPANFTAAAASESTAVLAWDDTNFDETGYDLERCTGDAAACPVDTGSFTPVSTFPNTQPGRLLHYRMNEAAWSGAAGEVVDVSGRSNHGRSYNGATTVASGKYGRAGNFDGSNDYVGTPVKVDQSAATAGATFEAWVYPTSSSGYRYVFGTENGGYDWGLLQNGSLWYIATGSSRYSTTIPVDLNTWQHVAVVFVPGTGIRFYKNGAELKTFTSGYLGYDTSTANVAIGQAGNNVYYFAGRIDEAAIYDRPLAAADLLAHAQEGINLYRHTDTGLTPSWTYTYRLSATKTADCPWVTPYVTATATTTTPQPPAGFHADPGNTTRIDLGWTDTTTSESGFNLQRCALATCTDSDYADLLPPNAGTQAYPDNTACYGTTYHYRLRAVGTGWQTDWVYAQATTSAPSTPSLQSAQRISEVEARLSWTDINNDETGFRIERCVDAVCDEFTTGASPYADNELDPERTYTYRVRAYKDAACGWTSEYSNPATANTTLVAPVLTASQRNTTEIDLTWTDPTVSETGFRVRRCEGSTCTNFDDLTPPVVLQPGAIAYTDTTLCSDQTYRYQVEAFAAQNGLVNAGGGCWTRRAKVTFTSFAPNTRTYIDIPYDADMRADFGDIRFFDAKGKRELSYWIREKTDGVSARVWLQTGENNNIYLVYGNPSATDAGSDAPFTTAYDDFRGTTIDSAKWTVVNPRSAVEQNDDLVLKDVGDVWDTLLVSTATFGRAGSPILHLSLSIPADSAGSNYFMTGWYMNYASASISYFAHGLYWNNYSLYSRESSSSTASSKSYTAATDYEVKIEVKEAGGARYLIRGGAFADWTLLRETTYNYLNPMHLAILQNSHEARLHSLVVKQAAASLGAALAAEENNPACFSFATTWSILSNGDDAGTRAIVVPTNLAAQSVGDRQIDLSWTDGNGDETGFEIQRCTVEVDCPVYAPAGQAGGGATTFSDTTVEPSTTYSYRVRAYKTTDCGWQTDWSGTTADTTFPATASGLRATALNSRMIRLDWDDHASDEEGYEVEVQAWNERFVPIGSVGAVPTYFYVDTVGIEPGRAYRYRVRPFRGGDKSPYSNEATVTTPAWQAGDGTCPP